jgi:DNA-binding transcriptional LysR family regulator
VTYNPGTIHHELQRLALARSGAAPARIISASTTEAILGLVAAGVGYSLVPSIEEALLRRRGVVVRPFALGAEGSAREAFGRDAESPSAATMTTKHRPTFTSGCY